MSAFRCGPLGKQTRLSAEVRVRLRLTSFERFGTRSAAGEYYDALLHRKSGRRLWGFRDNGLLCLLMYALLMAQADQREAGKTGLRLITPPNTVKASPSSIWEPFSALLRPR